MVIHRSDLHGIFLRACQRAGVDLVNNGRRPSAYENIAGGARGDVRGRSRRRGRRGHRRGRPALRGPASTRGRRAGQQLGVRRLPRRRADRAGAGERHLPTDVVAVRRAAAATSCSTRCAAARCSTRSPSSSRPRRWRGEEDWGTPDELDAAFDGHLRADPAGPAADVARQVVAHVRPQPDHELGPRPDRAARRRRPPAAAVHGSGRDHGDRGRLGPGAARRPATARTAP